MIRRAVLASLLLGLASLPSTVAGQSGGYCDGYKDGFERGWKTEGKGNPGYPGCPGDPGGSGTAYDRGLRDGMLEAIRLVRR